MTKKEHKRLFFRFLTDFNICQDSWQCEKEYECYYTYITKTIFRYSIAGLIMKSDYDLFHKWYKQITKRNK